MSAWDDVSTTGSSRAVWAGTDPVDELGASYQFESMLAEQRQMAAFNSRVDAAPIPANGQSYERPVVSAVPASFFDPIVGVSLQARTTESHEANKVSSDTANFTGKIYELAFGALLPIPAIVFNKAYVGNVISLAGLATGKFTSNFEFDRFNQYWNGDGGPYVLSDREFSELKLASRDYKNKKPIIFDDGSYGYSVPISTYAIRNLNENLIQKYDYGIGDATLFLDKAGVPVGIYDYYNFNAAARAETLSEYATRATGIAGKVYGAKSYEITYGKYIKVN